MNFFRELVSGQKVRFINGQYNLDLTYITNRVIAMSFPASGFESTFRNNIDDVVKFLQEHHGDKYMLYNLSNRKYNYEKFGENRILEFAWEDHHSPPIDMLFDVCKKVDQFLNEDINHVAIIHCQAGKGRTGTLICCYMLYSGRASNPDEARLYYSKKRFNKAKSGVTQPSQIRYIEYFNQIFKSPDYCAQVKKLSAITFVGPSPKMSGNTSKPYVDIYTVKDMRKIYSGLSEAQTKNYEYKGNELVLQLNTVIYGDILIKFYHYGSLRQKFMFRLAFNTCMIDESNQLLFYLQNLDPDSTFKNKKFSKEFQVRLQFQDICEVCTQRQQFQQKCQNCQQEMQSEFNSWSLVYQIMNEYPKYKLIQSKILLFGDPQDDDFHETIAKLQNGDQVESDDDSESDQDSDGEQKEQRLQQQ
ncbi:unnamed protein product [Paramecium octaurelia]|uniref:Phosphatidylinositol-3,4,5-trisphosphate 3-phosphatase n=1 Tax=Paramecium octaurelia TaxID=43137 RepID=A0A8S1W0L1_PAROT|nr:unnamed protein product [Paramecium octaurelia]